MVQNRNSDALLLVENMSYRLWENIMKKIKTYEPFGGERKTVHETKKTP